ncbi:MFS transporter [Pendulispora rubella]|uniref:MFS transporter n=1 Tax=Pendulispora rubella TaxID=2741070 RepID=A0ABZ2KXE2_9BACT
MTERSPKLDIAVAIAVIAQQVAGKVARDSMFLARFPATSLPTVIGASAVLSLAAVSMTSRLMARKGPSRFVPALFALNALAFVLEWVLAPSFSGVSAAAIYVHTSVAGGLMISGFWSIVNERFDPHVARRNIIRITTGATLGGLIGGFASKRIAEVFEPRAILLMLAVVSALCVWGVGVLGRSLPQPSETSPPASFRDGLKPLAERPYLRRVLSMVVVVALFELFLDCALKTAAETTLHEARALVAFFALFHTAVGVLTFVVQVALSGVFLERFGLGATLAILPASVVAASFVAAGYSTLAAIAVAAGLETALASSLFRSAYEILFTPVPAHRKRALKVVVDVAVPRLGTMLGSVAVVVVVAVTAQISTVLMLGASALGVLGVTYGISLHRMYVAELATSLQLGIVKMTEKDARDATTRHTIMSTMALDRARLLAQIEVLRRADEEPAPRTEGERDKSDADLFDVLLRGLEGDDFDVCYANARALAAICAENPALAPHRDRVLELARGALSIDDPTWSARRHLRSDARLREGMHRGLEHVFTLLGLALDREIIKGCLVAFNGPDRRLRGTALEYLENALPNDVASLLRERIQRMHEEEGP